MALILVGLFIGVGFFFGFPIVRAKDYWRGEMKTYHHYKRYGKNDEKKISIVPWEVVAAGLFIWLVFMKNFLIPRTITMFLYSTPIVWLIVAGIVLIIGLVLFFKSTAGKVFVEFLKSKKKKLCPLITIKKK